MTFDDYLKRLNSPNIPQMDQWGSQNGFAWNPENSMWQAPGNSDDGQMRNSDQMNSAYQITQIKPGQTGRLGIVITCRKKKYRC